MPDYLYDLKERLISWPKIVKNNHKLQNLFSNFHKKVHLSPFMPHCWILPNANFRIISTLFTTSPSIYLLQYFISEGKSWITKHFIFQGCALALEKFGSLKQKHFWRNTLQWWWTFWESFYQLWNFFHLYLFLTWKWGEKWPNRMSLVKNFARLH